MNNPKFISFAESGIDFIDGDRGTNYPSKSELIANGYCMFLNTGNVKKTGFDFTQVEFIDEEKDKKLRKGKVRQGDIVLTTRGTVGNVALVTSDTPFKNIRINSGMVIVRTDPEKYDPYFILLFFRSSLFQKQCLSHGSGSAQPQLPISALKYISFPNIDIYHQRKVVSAASCIDKKIELNNRINAELEAMAKTLYDYWFVQFDFPFDFAKDKPDDSPQGQGKPYKTSGGKMVYNPTLKREIPEGWEVKKLADVTSLIRRGISPKYTDEGGISVLNQKCVRDQRISFEDARRHKIELDDEDERLLKPFDVVVNSTGVGTLGRVAFVKRLLEKKTTVDSHVSIVRAKSELVSPQYLAWKLMRHQPVIESAANGSTGQVELSKSFLEDVDVIIPSDSIVRKFDEFVSPLVPKLASRESENEQLIQLRDWLLPMLMNGQVTVGEAS